MLLGLMMQKECKKLLCDNGIRNTRTYTGLTNNDIREQLLKDWEANKFEIMIATSAFWGWCR